MFYSLAFSTVIFAKLKNKFNSEKNKIEFFHFPRNGPLRAKRLVEVAGLPHYGLRRRTLRWLDEFSTSGPLRGGACAGSVRDRSKRTSTADQLFLWPQWSRRTYARASRRRGGDLQKFIKWKIVNPFILHSPLLCTFKLE